MESTRSDCLVALISRSKSRKIYTNIFFLSQIFNEKKNKGSKRSQCKRENKFYTRTRIRVGIRVSQLAKIPTHFPDW